MVYDEKYVTYFQGKNFFTFFALTALYGVQIFPKVLISLFVSFYVITFFLFLSFRLGNLRTVSTLKYSLEPFRRHLSTIVCV
jgi:hypothetical protein